MKKILVVLILLLLIAASCVYIFIPKKIIVAHAEWMPTNDKWSSHFLASKSMWTKWWPTTTKDTNAVFVNGQTQFLIDSIYYNQLAIKINSGEICWQSKISIIPVALDSTAIEWTCEINTSNNPLTRWIEYQKAVRLKKSMSEILSHLKSHLSNQKNIYGVTVTIGKIEDSLLIAYKENFVEYPRTTQVYSMIEKLKKYTLTKGVQITGHTMLNIDSTAPSSYSAYIAFPIGREIASTYEFMIKRMFPGAALITEVKGGRYTIENALMGLEQFKADHLMQVPAIPFQVMLNDRLHLADSSQWITKIYFPVF